MIPIQVVGLGTGPQDLTPALRSLIQEAEVLVGGARHLAYFPDHAGERLEWHGDLAAAVRRIARLAETRRVTVLASGDPNFFGIGPLLVKHLGANHVVVHPNITAVQAAFARLKMGWHDVKTVSLHGRNWEEFDAAVEKEPKVAVYTDPRHTPQEIARRLLEKNRAGARMCVLEDLGSTSERWTWMTPGEALSQHFSPLNLVVVLNDPPPDPSGLHLGMPEHAFEHQEGLITKREVRAVVLAHLALLPHHVLWDVGAGSGSVGLEASILLPRGLVVAVERKEERAACIERNRDRFGVRNLRVVRGEAPEVFARLPAPDRVFVGGGGPRLDAILERLLDLLLPGSRVVVSAALIESLQTARRVLERRGKRPEVTLLHVDRGRTLQGGLRLESLNPVWIVTAEIAE